MDLVSRAARLFGNAPFLLSGGERLSFGRCASISSHIAGKLHENGLRAGDTLAIAAPNSVQSVLLTMALLRSGIVCAPMNHRFPEARLLAGLQALRPELVVTDETTAMLKRSPFRTERLANLVDLKNSTPQEALPFSVPLHKNRPVTVIHTSASSGNPKAALHSFANHWYSALGAARNMPLGTGDCMLLSLPLFHIGGYAILFRALVSGCAMALPEPLEPLEKSLERFPVTHLSLVPTQLHRLFGEPTACQSLRELKAVLLGGSATPVPLLEQSVRQKIPVYLTYGSTEMSSQIATTRGPVTTAEEACAVVLPFREVRIGEENEILVRGACLFQGYVHEKRLLLPIDSDGWFHTGDTGRLDHNGKLLVQGRKDNMFISAGENLHPEEIEQVLVSIEGVLEAVVVPSPDSEYGWRPVAFIRTETRDTPRDCDISGELLKTVGKLKTPVRYTRVSEWKKLPGSQKIDRKWYQTTTFSAPVTPDASE